MKLRWQACEICSQIEFAILSRSFATLFWQDIQRRLVYYWASDERVLQHEQMDEMGAGSGAGGGVASIGVSVHLAGPASAKQPWITDPASVYTSANPIPDIAERVRPIVVQVISMTRLEPPYR